METQVRTHHQTQRRLRSGVGTIAALALIVLTGAGYRVTARRLDRLGKGISLQPGALDSFPMRIGDWTGREEPIDELIIERTDTDAHLSRFYASRGGRHVVSLFVGCGVRVRDLMPHRPEVCYTGAGWTLDEAHTEELKSTDGRPLPCRIMSFYRAGLDSQRVTVLNYYIVDNEYCSDVSLLRSKAHRFTGRSAYVAQIQIAARPDLLGQEAVTSLRAFAALTAPRLREVLEQAVEKAVVNDAS